MAIFFNAISNTWTSSNDAPKTPFDVAALLTEVHFVLKFHTHQEPDLNDINKYTNKIADKLKDTSKEELNHITNKLEQMKKLIFPKGGNGYIPANPLIWAVQDDDEILVDLLVTEDCCYLEDAAQAKRTLWSVEYSNNQKIIECFTKWLLHAPESTRNEINSPFWKEKIVEMRNQRIAQAALPRIKKNAYSLKDKGFTVTELPLEDTDLQWS